VVGSQACTSARIRPDLLANSLCHSCGSLLAQSHYNVPPASTLRPPPPPPKHHLIAALSLRPATQPSQRPQRHTCSIPPAAVGKRMRLRLLLLARRLRRDQSRPLLCQRARLQAQCQPHVTRRRAPRDYCARASESRSSRQREPFCRPRCV
jgi:hypothetical protein